MKITIIKIFGFLSRGERGLFDIPVKEQKAYLLGLNDPKDDIERSYNQYLCQMYFSPYWKQILLNVISAVFVPLFILYFFCKKWYRTGIAEVYDAIGDFEGMEEIIPQELISSYHIDNEVWCKGSLLSISDFPFLFNLISKYPLSPFFAFKIIIKISRYSYMIINYQPKALIVHNEYSFTSSALTSYCDYKKVLHINVMHGEKLYYIRDSFFRYDTCYVWNEYYKDLFLSLRAEETQFKIAVAPSLIIDCDKYNDKNYFADYKYYLTIYNEVELKSIIKSMEFVLKQGRRVVYRPHPRYSNIKLLESLVDKKDIEYPDRVSILNSVANLSFAIGSYTTVLNQAYLSGKKTILDDVTFKIQFEKLKEYMYFLADKKCIKLSNLQ